MSYQRTTSVWLEVLCFPPNPSPGHKCCDIPRWDSSQSTTYYTDEQWSGWEFAMCTEPWHFRLLSTWFGRHRRNETVRWQTLARVGLHPLLNTPWLITLNTYSDVASSLLTTPISWPAQEIWPEKFHTEEVSQQNCTCVVAIGFEFSRTNNNLSARLIKNLSLISSGGSRGGSHQRSREGYHRTPNFVPSALSFFGGRQALRTRSLIPWATILRPIRKLRFGNSETGKN